MQKLCNLNIKMGMSKIDELFDKPISPLFTDQLLNSGHSVV